MRRVNLGYKVIMAMLAGASVVLATLGGIDEMYFQIVSVFSSAFPIVWSQILDACKEYENEKSPSPSPKALSPAATTSIPLAPVAMKAENSV